jgi:hypothetical protein
MGLINRRIPGYKEKDIIFGHGKRGWREAGDTEEWRRHLREARAQKGL